MLMPVRIGHGVAEEVGLGLLRRGGAVRSERGHGALQLGIQDIEEDRVGFGRGGGTCGFGGS